MKKTPSQHLAKADRRLRKLRNQLSRSAHQQGVVLRKDRGLVVVREAQDGGEEMTTRRMKEKRKLTPFMLRIGEWPGYVCP